MTRRPPLFIKYGVYESLSMTRERRLGTTQRLSAGFRVGVEKQPIDGAPPMLDCARTAVAALARILFERTRP